METDKNIKKVLPVLFGFFIMGFVDLVGISTNYVKLDFKLNDTLANMLPMSLFLWFAILSVPTVLLMNKIGRKRTVLLSMAVSFVAMVLPLVNYSFPMILVAFALLGIGNTINQVSLNPLVSDVVSKEKLTSSLTLGQFIKAIAAFLGPIIAVYASSKYGDWKYIFMIYGVVTILAGLWLQMMPIKEAKEESAYSSIPATLGLLKDKTILMLFLGIVFVVGVDVGLNTTVPKFIMERCNIPLEKAGLGTSLYFIARTVGTFVGAILLVKISERTFFIWSMIVAIPAMIAMMLMHNLVAILVMVFIIGFAVANVFSIIFSAALKKCPERRNKISGLLIMGLIGGAVIPFCMALLSDSFGQGMGLVVLSVALAYLAFCAFSMDKGRK